MQQKQTDLLMHELREGCRAPISRSNTSADGLTVLDGYTRMLYSTIKHFNNLPQTVTILSVTMNRADNDIKALRSCDDRAARRTLTFIAHQPSRAGRWSIPHRNGKSLFRGTDDLMPTQSSKAL